MKRGKRSEALLPSPTPRGSSMTPLPPVDSNALSSAGWGLLTADTDYHCQSCEDACQTLPTHDGSCVAGRQEAGQTKEAALQHGAKGCKGKDKQR